MAQSIITHTRSSSATSNMMASRTHASQQPLEQSSPKRSSAKRSATYHSNSQYNTISENSHRLISTHAPAKDPALVYRNRVGSNLGVSISSAPDTLTAQREGESYPNLLTVAQNISLTTATVSTPPLQLRDHLSTLRTKSSRAAQGVDGTSELARVRASLRSVTENPGMKHYDEGQGQDTLDELDSLLLSAIKERPHSEDECSSHDDQSEVVSPAGSHGVKYGKASQIPLQQPTNLRASLAKQHRYDYAGLPATFNSPAQANRRTGVLTERYSIAETQPTTLSAAPQISPSKGSAHAPEESLAERRFHTDQDIQTRPQSPSSDSVAPDYQLQKPSAFLRYSSNPISQRAAVFGTLVKQPLQRNPDCQAPHSGDVHFKESWVTQPAFKKPPKPARRIFHPQTISPTTGDPCLIPLQLPRLVGGYAIPKDLESNNDMTDSPGFITARKSRNSKTNFVQGHPYELEGQDPFLVVEPNTFREVYTDTEDTNDQTPQLQPDKFAEICHHPPQEQSRPGSPHGPSTGQAATTHVSIDTVQGEISPGSKRPSIVKSKIQQLMAASNKNKGFSQKSGLPSSMVGAATSSQIKEIVDQGDAVAPKKLPALQMPLSEQAKMFREEQKLSSTPSEGYFHLYRSSVTTPGSTQQTISPARSRPGSPLRGHAKSIRQSISSRGSPYTVEQSYTLSPVRNMSINDRSGVKVSIELRRSPEREGTDEHLLIVRASVEPEESGD